MCLYALHFAKMTRLIAMIFLKIRFFYNHTFHVKLNFLPFVSKKNFIGIRFSEREHYFMSEHVNMLVNLEPIEEDGAGKPPH